LHVSSYRQRSLLLCVLMVAAVAASSPVSADNVVAPPACRHEPLDSGTVDKILDGRTLVLANGREVRIADIEVPGGDAGLAARAALGGLVAEAEVILKSPSFFDRYGRLVAHVMVMREGSEQSVAQALLAAGHALVGPNMLSACAAENWSAERAARRAKLGLWSDPYYEIMSADRAEAVVARRGHFTLVEGKVVSVRESGVTIYVNFGRRWSEDFTVTLLKRNERSFVDAGIEPKKLEGRRVRVRGWVEEHGGPWIEALHPTQIEIVN
jgi:endonuclease YncB( thermonuclease family)